MRFTLRSTTPLPKKNSRVRTYSQCCSVVCPPPPHPPTLSRGAADPKIGKDYKYFYPDAESLVVGMTTANTHFEDIKIKAKKKLEKKKRLEEEKKNPKKKKEKKKAAGGGGGNGLDGLLESIKAQAAAQGANIGEL